MGRVKSFFRFQEFRLAEQRQATGLRVPPVDSRGHFPIGHGIGHLAAFESLQTARNQ
jgi:hypothetical protein